MTTPAVAPEMGAALQALLVLGSAQDATFTSTSETEMEQFAASNMATTERLAAFLGTGRSQAGAAAGRGGDMPGLLLLADVSVRRAIHARFMKDFEYVALRRNQFLLIGDGRRAELAEIFEAFLDDLLETLADGPSDDAESRLRQSVVDHHVALWQFSRALVAEQFAVDGGDVPFAPPCHEYDPEFQLALWGLHRGNVKKELMEPILDLGCGPSAVLVRYLRQAGLDARGVDKFADGDQFVTRDDWLTTPLAPRAWGTIISHMAFSNHFFHHHLRKDGHPERYARRFMEIVDSLKPGGRFLYAPGLPFFEPLLPEDRLQVVVHPIDVDLDVEQFLSAMDDGVRAAQSSAARNGATEPGEPGLRREEPDRRQSGGDGAEPLRRPGLYATEIRVLRHG